LKSLRRGHLLTQIGDSASGCVLDGMAVYHSFRTLLAYKLIKPCENPKGFPGVKYFCISDEGEAFAARIFDAPGAQASLNQAQVEKFSG
jgi:hypothetical protein